MQSNDKNEERILNITYAKSGNNYLTTRLNVPKSWIDAMGITQDDRQVIVKKINDKIIIEKYKNS